jgi:hypothetical protein
LEQVREIEAADTFVGDVAAASGVTVNSKGGSLTATLKKALREKLGDVADFGGQLAGAAVQFPGGPAVVLLSPASGLTSPIRVQQTGRNRFEIELDSGEGEEVDEVTAAFLRLKQQQFVSGELELMGPAGAEQLAAEAGSQMAEAREAVAALTRRSAKK